MVRVSSLAKLRPWSELTAKVVKGVVPGLVIFLLLLFGQGFANQIAQKKSVDPRFGAAFQGPVP